MCIFVGVCCFSFEHCSISTVEDMMLYETSLIFYCSQMMEMSRDVWKSSPNVMAHIEMEAKIHQLDDELRRKKVQQLQVSLFLINLIFLVSKLLLIRIRRIFFRREFPTKWNSTIFSMGQDECLAFENLPVERTTVYFIKKHGCSDCSSIRLKREKHNTSGGLVFVQKISCGKSC